MCTDGGRLFVVSAAAVLTTLASFAAPAAAQEVVFVPLEGSPDSVLADTWTGTQGSAAPQDCSASPPAGIVTWLFVLPQADPNLPENIFESVTLRFEGAGEVAGVATGAYAVAATPTDDILLGGAADVLESALDGVPPTFDLVSTCSTVEPPPTTTTTTTTVPDTEPPTTPPPTTAPPDPTPVPTGGGGSSGGSGESGGGDRAAAAAHPAAGVVERCGVSAAVQRLAALPRVPPRGRDGGRSLDLTCRGVRSPVRSRCRRVRGNGGRGHE